MITKAQITKIASRDGVSARTVERDYVLAHLVAAFSKENSINLVFKGGTSLRFLHLNDYRYSADLDYSLVGSSKNEGLSIVKKALSTISPEVVAELKLTDDKPPRIAYVGPLEKERKIKLDLADDELVLETESRALQTQWQNVPDTQVLAYSQLEIAGEKLRCILQRLQCRDLFDLNILFNELSVHPSEAAEVFHKKAVHRGLSSNSFSAKYNERLPQYESRWQNELQEHLSLKRVPHFTEVERKVSRVLRQAGLI